jgi:hypothetical protein
VRDFIFMLPKEAIEELKQIYKEENGKELSDSAALEMGNGLLNLYRVLLKPFSEEEIKEFKKIQLCQKKKK